MNQNVGALLRERKRKYFARGIAFAVASGICYGLYTGFLTLGETQGVWGEWFAGSEWGEGNPALGTFTIVFALAALAAGINDLASAIWSLIVCAKNRQLGDLWKTMKTRPGLVMMLCAAIGGPFAGSAFELAGAAFASPALVFFVISGFFAMPAFSFWYKGNSMCGTALGMACNGMYAFWGPFFIWIIMGVLNIGGMSADYPPLSVVQWIGALMMVAGIFCIAVSPAKFFNGSKKGE